MAISVFGAPVLAWADADGNILGADGSATTVDIVTERVATLDVDALASAWAARDAQGEGIGVASPPATTEANLRGANIEISYSQPAKRAVRFGEASYLTGRCGGPEPRRPRSSQRTRT